MQTLLPKPDHLQSGETQIISRHTLHLRLSQRRESYRHGWQSWALTIWRDPGNPPLPVRAAEFRVKDEDPGYGLHQNHVGAWVGVVELDDEDILLLGALDLGGRV